MGFFSRKKTVSVSSTVYSLAGAEEDKIDFLKSTMFSAVMSSNSNRYIGETIVGNYLKGPAITQRSFFNWAVRTNFAGLPVASIWNYSAVPRNIIVPEIPVDSTPSGLEISLENAFITENDCSYFAEKYILDNHPELVNTDWISDYDEINNQISIQYEDSTQETIPVGDYTKDGLYIAARYQQIKPTEESAIVEGTPVTNITDSSNLYDDTGYTLDSQTTLTTVVFNLNKKTTVSNSYSDNTPDDSTETNEASVESFDPIETIKYLEEYQGGDDFGTTINKTIYILNENRAIEVVTTTSTTTSTNNGVTKTTITTVEEDTLIPVWDYRIDTQKISENKVYGGNKLFIYKHGSGNTNLDNYITSTTVSNSTDPEFYPIIPIRTYNTSITDQNGNGLYDECSKAYRKATGGSSFKKIVKSVEDNPSIGDIDFCYLVFGVPLNVKDNLSQKYIYTFLKGLIPYQNTSTAYMNNFISSMDTYNTDLQNYTDWVNAQDNSNDPLYETPKPDKPVLDEPEVTLLKLATNDPRTASFSNTLSWINVEEEIFTGLSKPNVKVGDYWFEKDTPLTWNDNSTANSLWNHFISDNKITKINLYSQISVDSYSRLTVFGLSHNNYIYAGKSINTDADNALTDLEESGLIIPIHRPTIKNFSIVEATQIASQNSYLIFNTYTVTKQKWYQTGFFKILVIIAIIVVAVLVNPAALASAGGILGTNLAVGTAIGLTGTAAILVGAISNAIIAIVISSVISNVSSDLFGDKWGALIGAIISFSISFAAGGGFSNLSSLSSVDNIMKIGNVLANGYQGWTQANIQEMYEEFQTEKSEYEQSLEKINKLISDISNGNLSFDPIELTNYQDNSNESTGGFLIETLDEFINRTTMVGSDLVDITHSMVTNYPDINLILPKTT